jgi:hypothetical protein
MSTTRSAASYLFAIGAIACAFASWNWKFFYSVSGQRSADILVLALSILASGGGLVSFFISGKGFSFTRVVSVLAVLVSAPIWLFFAYLLLKPGVYVSH